MPFDFSKLSKLRGACAANEIFLISKNNTYLTENVAPADNDIHYLTGFAGSAGVLGLTQKEAILWVDGRYLGIARKQFANTKELRVTVIKSMFSGGMNQYIRDFALQNGKNPKGRGIIVSLNPSKWSSQHIQEFKQLLPEANFRSALVANGRGRSTRRVVDVVMPGVTGASVAERLKELRRHLSPGCTHLFSNPEDVAWTLNLRANDFPNLRCVRGRLLLNRKQALFFSELSDEDHERVASFIRPWDLIPDEDAWVDWLEELAKNDKSSTLIVEHHNRPGALNCELMNRLKKLFPEGRLRQEPRSIAEKLRIVKNPMEQAELTRCGKKLAEVMTESLDFLQTEIDRGRRLTERAFGLKIEQIARHHGATGSTFGAITGSGPNGAMPHHQWQKGKQIQEGEIIVVDIGYYFGVSAYATDMTRTILVGSSSKPTETQRRIYTRVLGAFLRQLFTEFEGNTLTAKKLDDLARSDLNEERNNGFGFIHGTGHGLGINDHELAITISPASNITLKQGYCYSIEPGLYSLETKRPNRRDVFGVRIEDCVLVQKKDKELYHQSLSPAPFDRRLIDKKQLGKTGIERLERYEAML